MKANTAAAEADLLNRFDALIKAESLRFSCSAATRKDLIQEGREAFLRAYRNWSMKASLWTYCRHHVFWAMLRFVSESRADHEEFQDNVPVTDPLDAEFDVDLADAIGRIPEEDREVLRLTFVEGMSTRDLAGYFGKTKSEGDRKYQHAINALRETIGSRLDVTL